MKTNGLPSSDLVSRADVIIEFIKLFGCIQDVSDIEEWADICQTTVNEIPSSKTIQGEWIKTVDGNGWNDWYVLKCPFCGATIEDKQYRSWEYNFCPNCGKRVWGERSE